MLLPGKCKSISSDDFFQDYKILWTLFPKFSDLWFSQTIEVMSYCFTFWSKTLWCHIGVILHHCLIVESWKSSKSPICPFLIENPKLCDTLFNGRFFYKLKIKFHIYVYTTDSYESLTRKGKPVFIMRDLDLKSSERSSPQHVTLTEKPTQEEIFLLSKLKTSDATLEMLAREKLLCQYGCIRSTSL